MKTHTFLQASDFRSPISDLRTSTHARVGKIARLPVFVREQLHQRLFNGDPGKNILPWLNELPEVRKILAEQFAGHSITENNLSKWRRGGYQDWLRERETQSRILQWVEKCQQMEPEARLRYIESLIVAQFTETLQALHEIPDADARLRRFEHMCREFVRLQKRHTFGLQAALSEKI